MTFRFRLTASLALLFVALPATAGQPTGPIALGDGTIELLDDAGNAVIVLDNGANYTAGGNGYSPTMFLRSLDEATTFTFLTSTFDPAHVFLRLGAASHEGILLLKDDDGVTTTIDLDGRTGAVRLGGNNERGELIVLDDNAVETARFDGFGGTITNRLTGNGLVKAWARIHGDGTVLSCWRCDPMQTERFATGFYRVNFAVLGANVHGRPRSAVLDSHSTIPQTPATIQTWDSPISNATVSVYISTFTSTSPEAVDRAFTLLVH